MIDQKILNANCLIAEFEGFEYKGQQRFTLFGKKKRAYTYKNKKGNFSPIYSPEYFKYHCDWNWLTWVIESIEKIHDEFHGWFQVHISGNNCTIQGSRLDTRENGHYAYFADHHGHTKIEATFYAVVEFIKWYNANLKIN